MDSLQKLSLPAETLERVKQLTGDLRLLCAKEVFKEAIEGKTGNPPHFKQQGSTFSKEEPLSSNSLL